MESLQVRTGQKSLQILDDNGDVRGIFKFNPEDVNSAKQILRLQQELEPKIKEFKTKFNESDSADNSIELLNEVVDYFEASIDAIFGIGSSQILFGNAKTLSMFNDFFEGIMPYYQKASEKRMSKYTKKRK